MQLHIDSDAINWFEKELELEKGAEVQFFVRYGGCGDFQSSFSLGVAVKEADEPAVSIEKKGYTFYVEQKDEWYFDGIDLEVMFDSNKDEISYNKK